MITIRTATTVEDFDKRIRSAREDILILELGRQRNPCFVKQMAEAKVRLTHWENKKKEYENERSESIS